MSKKAKCPKKIAKSCEVVLLAKSATFAYKSSSVHVLDELHGTIVTCVCMHRKDAQKQLASTFLNQLKNNNIILSTSNPYRVLYKHQPKNLFFFRQDSLFRNLSLLLQSRCFCISTIQLVETHSHSAGYWTD